MTTQILLNGTDDIEMDVYYNGILTTPDSITIKTITDVDGVVRLSGGVAVVGSPAGRYSYTIPSSITDKLGMYTAIWEFAIGAVTFQHVQNFEIVSVVRNGYITVEQFREMALYDIITDDYPSDVTIQKHINRATSLINKYLNGSIEYAYYTETRRCALNKRLNGLHIQLTHRPIISVTSVAITMTPNSTSTMSTDNIRVNSTAGYLEYLYDFTWPNSLQACTPVNNIGSVIPHATVTYASGYLTIPEDVEQATVMMTEELLKKTFGEGETVKSVSINKDRVTFGDSVNVSEAKKLLGTDNATGIVNLLKPYKNHKTILVGPLG